MPNLEAFIARYLGKARVGNTPENTGECVGLVQLWLTECGKPHVWGDAKDLLTNAAPFNLPVIKNTPTNAPKAGAIICWGASWGAGHGHTAVVIAANLMHVAVFEQNNPLGMPPIVATHSYDGVLGWIAQ